MAEAMGGLRHLTGEPGRVPVRVGVSIGDTLAALHGTIGVLLALHHRKVNGGQGQVIDVALHEAVFNVMESLLPEYSAFGAVREAAGSALPGIAPSNAYPCTDGWVLVAGNGDSIFKRLMDTIGRDDLGRAPDLADNAGRVARVEEIDAAIGAWSRAAHGAAGAGRAGRRPRARRARSTPPRTSPKTRTTAPATCCCADHARRHSVEVPGIVPKLSATPGTIRSSAPHLGEDTDAVLARNRALPRRLRCCAAKGRSMNASSTVWQGAGRRIHMQEVGTRDGLQMEPRPLCPPTTRSRWSMRCRMRGYVQDRGDLVHLAQGHPGAARRRDRDARDHAPCRARSTPCWCPTCAVPSAPSSRAPTS
jgi:hypothetical protein